MREVLTVSLGNYANHVNAHYWNFQDELAGIQTGTAAEVDHEVLFRATEDAAGETAYVPRVVMLDTKGSLGSLSRLGGTLYSDSPDPTLGGYSSLGVNAMASAGVWGGGVHTIVQQRIPQSSYIQSLSAIDGPMEHESAQGDEGEGEGGDDDSGDLLKQNDSCAGTDDGRGPAVQTADPGYAQAVAAELQQAVRYWSDFLKVHIHPRSLHTLERVNRCDSFDCYAAGTEAFKSDLAVDEAVDACRRFLEECDLLQGFQILADTDTAWGGVAVELIEYLRDDYRATPMIAMATAEHGGFAKHTNSDVNQDTGDTAVAEARRPLNAALSMVGLSEHASLVVPVHCTNFGATTGTLAQYHVRFPTNTDYNTSAVAGVAMETATLPYRMLAHQRGRMSDLTSVLVSSGERRPIPLCSLEVQMPLDWHQLVLDVEGRSSQLAFDADLASHYLSKMFDSGAHSSASPAQDGRCYHSSVSTFTPQFRQASQLLPAGEAWESWNKDQLRDVYTVRGLDLRLRRGIAAPAPSTAVERQHNFYARNQCSAFVGGTLPLPLCFPPVLHNGPPDAHEDSVSHCGGADGDGAADPVLGLGPEPEAEPAPEPEPEPEGKSTGVQLLHEAAVATRLTTAPAGMVSMVHASQEVVRAARTRQSPTMMAAVGGVGPEGLEQLGEAEEVLTSMRDSLYASLHVDSGEMDGSDADDY